MRILDCGMNRVQVEIGRYDTERDHSALDSPFMAAERERERTVWKCVGVERATVDLSVL